MPKSRGRPPSRGRRRPRPSRPVRPGPGAGSGILDLVRRALDTGEPRPLLELTSQLLDQAGLPVDDVVQSFWSVETPESSALLTALVTVGRRDDLRVRVADEVRRRGHVFPRWLAELHRTEPGDRAVLVTEPLEDGCELLVGVEVPGGFPLSVAVFVDNNLNSAVKDALVAPRALDVAAREIHAAADDPDLVFSAISPADARARILEGIQAGSLFHPPLQTESWPRMRPLLEWVASLLPAGGSGPVAREWSDDEVESVVAGFFSSPSGTTWRREEVGPLVEEIALDATEDAARDPLLISPVWVEIALVNVLPYSETAAGFPPDVVLGVLRDFIRYGHAERGIREGLTAETLRNVDRFADRFRAAAAEGLDDESAD